MVRSIDCCFYAAYLSKRKKKDRKKDKKKKDINKPSFSASARPTLKSWSTFAKSCVLTESRHHMSVPGL